MTPVKLGGIAEGRWGHEDQFLNILHLAATENY